MSVMGAREDTRKLDLLMTFVYNMKSGARSHHMDQPPIRLALVMCTTTAVLLV